MPQVASDDQQQLISRFRKTFSTYQEHRDLIAVGAYQHGSDAAIDEAVARWPAMIEFLRQHQHERVTSAESILQLRQLLDTPTNASVDVAAGAAAER